MELRGYAQEKYLQRATRFLEHCRNADPLGGMWDVGDIQWWWRDGGYENPATQLFLETEDGREAHAMILLSQKYATFDYEILPGSEETKSGLEAFNIGLQWLETLETSNQEANNITFFVNEKHGYFRQSAEARGYKLLPRGHAQLALNLEGERLPERPPDSAIVVRSVEDSDIEEGHPPVIRTPPQNFDRILRGPLYRRCQHLIAVNSDNQVMAECIFWIDRRNAIGMFEPVETKPGFRRRGAARALLVEGLNRMNAIGVRIAKVSHYTDNDPAGSLYRSIGFEHQFTRLIYWRNWS